MAVVESNVYKYKKACMTRAEMRLKFKKFTHPKGEFASICQVALWFDHDLWQQIQIQSLVSILNCKYIPFEIKKTKIQITIYLDLILLIYVPFLISGLNRGPQNNFGPLLHWIYPCLMPFHVQNKTREPFLFIFLISTKSLSLLLFPGSTTHQSIFYFYKYSWVNEFWIIL